MRDHSLDRQDNLFDFFHSHLGAAAKDQRTPVSQEGVFYLARVLVERGVEPPRGDRADTLAELHIQAAQGSRIEAIRSYRQLGDQALVTAGFFRDSLNGRAVGLDYYVEMGAAACRWRPSPGARTSCAISTRQRSVKKDSLSRSAR